MVKPMKKPYKYDAFISYRHADLDRFVAENLQKQLEWFKIPGSLKKDKKLSRTKIERIFRDKDELPLTNNLEDPIRKALEESEYLIVICSPRLKESLWCRKEIETFISLHGRENIFAVLVEGEPAESFPEELLYREKTVTHPDGSTETVKEEMEPLAADVRGKNKRDVLKVMKTEKLRLIAPMLGVGFDDLKQRHREQKLKKTLGFTAAGAAVCLAFGVVSTAMAMQIREQKKQIQIQNDSLAEQAAQISSQNEVLSLKQALSLAEESERLLDRGDRIGAMQAAVSALTEYDGIAMPYTTEAQKALTDSLYAYNRTGDYLSEYEIKTDAVVSDLQSSTDFSYYAVAESSGKITVRESLTGQIVGKLSGAGETDSLVFIDGSRLAYVDENRQLSIFDAAKRETVTVNMPDNIYHIYLSGDKKCMAVTGFRFFQIVETADFTEVASLDEYVQALSGRVCFNGDSTAVAFLQGKDDSLVAEEKQLLYVNLADDTVKAYDWTSETIADVAFRNGYMYILSYEAQDELYSAFDSFLAVYREGTGQLLYKKEYRDAMVNHILLSAGDDDSMLLYGGYAFYVVSGGNGEVLSHGETGITGIVRAEAVNDTNLYTYITDDGCQYIISYESNVTFTHGVTFSCFDGRICYVTETGQGYVMSAYSENRAVCYRRFYLPEEMLTDKTADKADTELLYGSSVTEIVNEEGYVMPRLAESIFYNEDKSLTFVNYEDDSLRIYDSASGELLYTLTDMPGSASEYYGKDAEGNFYVGSSSWAYMISPAFETLSFIRGIAEVEESGELLLTDNVGRYYLCPVYTLDELLAMAEADVVKYTQNEITE